MRNKSILQSDMSKCYVCGQPKECIHEVYFGNANRQKSIRYGCYVALCNNHHNMKGYGVHFNKALDLNLKQDCQKKFEEIYDHDKFMEVFHKSYI